MLENEKKVTELKEEELKDVAGGGNGSSEAVSGVGLEEYTTDDWLEDRCGDEAKRERLRKITEELKRIRQLSEN